MKTMDVESDPKPRMSAHERIEDLQHRAPHRVFMAIVWIFAVSMLGLYTYRIANQMIDSKTKPTSTVTYESVDKLPYPGIAICSFDTLGQPTVPEGQEPLLTVYGPDDVNPFVHRFIYSPLNRDVNSCWLWNFVPKGGSPVYANETGYNGAKEATFILDFDNPGILAASVSFFAPDTDPATIGDYVWSSVTFASVGQVSVFQVQYVSTIRNEDNYDKNNCGGPPPAGSPGDPNCLYKPYNKTEFTFQYTGVTMSQRPVSENQTGIGHILVSYQTLNLQTVEYQTAYKIINFFGDFGGIFGLLMGIDLVKIMSGIAVIVLSVVYRTLRPVESHFNG